ncbi:TetR/AcrR family transcriptional regulator [Nocardioides sp. BGMRC 2183]|nr:TetR/AcrR family transcriptional regulator [Nocardioides sp. BGMRC 2183]
MTQDSRTGASKAPRADRVRNRARVADAAYLVFAERGLGATVAQVAQRAGVGNATVFRHFPTKEDLLDEVAARWLEDWARVMEDRLDGQREGALSDLLPVLFERLRTDRFTLDVLRAGVLHSRVEHARRGTQLLFTRALDRAVAEGLVRPDLTYADMAVLVLGVAGQLAEFEDFDADRWRRHADLVWAAIRA